MTRESLNLEFKREFTEDIKKTVVAFANTDGGEIRIGVDDDGRVLGLAEPNSVILKVTNSIRDSIKPDVTLFTHCEGREINGKVIVTATVQRGTARPYYLAGKGVRPEGVYVRQGASTVPASDNAILKMIKETAGDSYERARSLTQDLTFQEAAGAFQTETIPFGTEQKKTLGLIGRDGLFSNLALLLSDQCPHTIRLAEFQGASKRVFRNREEFSGSLLKQLEDAYKYLDRVNRTRAEFSGLKRVDLRDYPPEALREALLNAVVHRDYSSSASTLVSVFDDRVEFVSLGGLPMGIEYDDMMLGVSVLRNKRLAEVFYRLRLMEAFGTGIPKITAAYQGRFQGPKIELSSNAFKITLPNVNFPKERVSGAEASSPAASDVLQFMDGRGSLPRREIESALGLSQSATVRLLNGLISQGLVQRRGEGKNTTYTLSSRE